MASYVERILEFLEKIVKMQEIPKHLQEDIQWAIETISSNKLYVGNFDGFKLSEERKEIKAWTDMIALRNLPISLKNAARLQATATLLGLDENGKIKKQLNNKGFKLK